MQRVIRVVVGNQTVAVPAAGPLTKVGVPWVGAVDVFRPMPGAHRGGREYAFNELPAAAWRLIADAAERQEAERAARAAGEV